VQEYQFELNRMKSENEELRNAREIAEKNYHVVMNNNNALQIKLENIGIVYWDVSLNRKSLDFSILKQELLIIWLDCFCLERVFIGNPANKGDI